MLHCDHWDGVTSLLDRDGHHVTNGTATPAQPDSQTIHLNAAQQQDASPPANSRALLLQTTDIPAEAARLVR